MAIWPGTNGNDILSGTQGDDYFTPIKGDDIVSTGPGRDSVEIEPYSGNDTIVDFTSGEDTLLINYFPTIDSPDDVYPFVVHDSDRGITTIDVSAAAAETPGTLVVTFRESTMVRAEDIGVNTGEFYDPDYVPYPPDWQPINADDFGQAVGTTTTLDQEVYIPPIIDTGVHPLPVEITPHLIDEGTRLNPVPPE
jgi:hypothetical protein